MDFTVEGISKNKEVSQRMNIQLYFIKKLMELTKNQTQAISDSIKLKKEHDAKSQTSQNSDPPDKDIGNFVNEKI